MIKKTFRVFLMVIFTYMLIMIGGVIYYVYVRKVKKVDLIADKPSTINNYGIPIKYVNHIMGMDVSQYQKNIDWIEVSNNPDIEFVFIRSTYGNIKVDPYYHINYDECKKYGIRRASYHYFLPNVDGKVQAEYFIKNAKFEKGDLLPVLDIEKTHKKGKKILIKEINKFLETVKKELGVDMIIYSYNKFYKDHLSEHYRSFPLWIAHYKIEDINGRVNRWNFWQFTETAIVKGVPGYVDLNVFNGNSEQLMKYTIQ